MTKKHFVALAEALKLTKPSEETSGWVLHLEQWFKDLHAIGERLEEMFPNFNGAKWMNYAQGIGPKDTGR